MIVCWPINQFLVNQTFQVSRLRREFPSFGLYLPVSRLIKANLPVITNLLNLPVSLLISRFFSLFSCFPAVLLLFRIEKPELSHLLSVIGFESGFCLHPNENSDREIISKMASKMRTKIHRNSMKKFLQTKICLYSSPSYNISGQWSNGSASQSFAFGSNLPVLR